MGSSPDDDFHLTSTWCAWGDRAGACQQEKETPLTVTVPRQVAKSSACFSLRPGIGGYCTEHLASSNVSGVTRVNSNLYPGLYYKVAGLFVGPDVQRSVFVIRVFNVAVASVLLLGVLLLTPAIQRRSYVLAFSVVGLPLGIYITASNNPSSWAFTGAAAFWVFLLLWQNGIGSAPGRRLAIIAIGLVISGAMLIGARADGAMLACVEVVVMFLIYGRVLAVASGNPRHAVLRLLPSVLAILAAALVITSTSQVAVNARGMEGIPPVDAEQSWTHLLLQNFISFPHLILGVVGGEPLGWLDTPMPAVVLFVGSLALGALLFVGLKDMWWQKGISLVVVLVPMVAIPMVVRQLGRSISNGGGIQSRYLLPFLLFFVCVLLLTRIDPTNWSASRLHRALFILGMSVSGAAAFRANLERYAVDANDHARTWAVLPLPPSLLILLVLVASGAFYWAVIRCAERLEPSGITCSTG